MNCTYCTAPTSNGLVLCDRCQIAASVIFEFLPVYFRNLARWRPGRAGSRPVPGSREPAGLGISTANDRIGAVLDEVGNDVGTWARCLADDRSIDLPAWDEEAEMVVALCRVFAQNLTSIATLEWCGEFLAQMTEHEKRLRKLTERVAPGWYAGACIQCGHATYVIPGLTWVKCEFCGSSSYARDHLEIILSEARGWVAPPKRLAEAIVALVDTEQSVPKLHTRIRQWAHLEELTPIRRTERDYVWSDELEKLVVADVEVGRARYRFGEVLDRAMRKEDSPVVVGVRAS